MKYSEELIKRFVKDYNLPIQITETKYFDYFLDLYEKDLGSSTKFEKLLNEIKNKFDSNESLFLENYYKTRNNIIDTILKSDSYKFFNSMDMKIFNIKKYDISKSDVFKETNIGKTFISVDLVKANFQALKYIDKEIVLWCDTYEEFISKFTDSEYMKNSKYLRQVIFGKLNPSRHISVERHIMGLIMEIIKSNNEFDELIPVSISNDEIVFELPDIKENIEFYTNKIHDLIYSEMDGIETKVVLFNLKGIKFINERTIKSETFFETIDLSTGKHKLKCVPVVYYAQVHKFIKNLTVVNIDKLFLYDNNLAELTDNFKIQYF